MCGMSRRKKSWCPMRTVLNAVPHACSVRLIRSNGTPRAAVLEWFINMAESAQSVPSPEPRKPLTPEEINKLKVRVEAVLDKIRPAIQMDGGDADLVDLTPEGLVIVQLTGHCETCSLSPVTMKLGVQRMIMDEIPEITGVESV